MNTDYLDKEVPDQNVDLVKSKLTFVDGKDWSMVTKTNDNAISK